MRYHLSVPISAVCFDLGGVLVRLAASWSEALRWAGLNVEPRPELDVLFSAFEPYNTHELGLLSDEDYFEELRNFLGLETAEQALLAHLWVLGPPYDGTLEIVQSLHAAGIKTGCLSNTEAHHWQRMTGGFYPAIAAIQCKGGSHLLGARKPDAAVFEAFERLSGFDRAAVLYFDDSPGHVAAARDFGWTAVRIDPAIETAPQIRRAIDEAGLQI